jgi:antitoxin PrlF
LSEEVTVTRKYQVTIPESVRKKLGVKIGDKLIVKSEDKRIIMENPKRISNPSDTLWNLFGEPMDIDAVKLVEQSWEENKPAATRQTRSKNPKETTN